MIVGEVGFPFPQGADLLFNGAGDHQLIDEHGLGLDEAVGAVGGLVFDGGVPPAGEVNHGIGIVALPLSIFVLSCKAPPVAAVKPSGRVAEVRGGENQSACLRIPFAEGSPVGAGRDAARFRIGPSSCGSIT